MRCCSAAHSERKSRNLELPEFVKFNVIAVRGAQSAGTSVSRQLVELHATTLISTVVPVGILYCYLAHLMMLRDFTIMRGD